ncbi:peptidoglycan editing factor PgeF [Idiomarina xiamenensis]|uniref:Purine nucleoside phosphorylase n=1 Tax=Idiomarina xiamenensis 10-D-4 TaxID=740709 RepID=K2K1B9_9GAMM|nr:peptidoglycan editing factor PgeF [Idiomarina xiamenensis]EKE80527.1 hypothetical protein A10D4_12121 [Idiomarina xiamenensis 10-D-4]
MKTAANTLIKRGLYQADWQLPDGVKAFYSSAAFGNLAAHVGDDISSVMRRRISLTQLLALPAAPSWLQQVHGSEVAQYGRLGLDKRQADAVYSNSGKPCGILTADCLPILLCHQDGQQLAAVHAGWRGLYQGVVEQAVARFSGAAKQLSAWIGPAISAQHFEVGDDVYQAFVQRDETAATAFQALPQAAKWLCNLPLLAELRLRAIGVSLIKQSQLCSYADSRFYSYRRQPDCGRMLSLIWRA